MDEKGYGSNAYLWRRLKEPNTLSPYLRIAESLGIKMSAKSSESFEYDPEVAHSIRSPVHADFQNEAWFPYLHDSKMFPRDPDSKHIVACYEHKPIVFYQPYNATANIVRARNRIAEHLEQNNLSLVSFIRDSDLISQGSCWDHSVRWHDMEGNGRSVNPSRVTYKRTHRGLYERPRHIQIREDDDWYSSLTSSVLDSPKSTVSWSERFSNPRMKTRSILRNDDKPSLVRDSELPNLRQSVYPYQTEESSLLGNELDVDVEPDFNNDSLLTRRQSDDEVDDDFYERYVTLCKKNGANHLLKFPLHVRGG